MLTTKTKENSFKKPEIKAGSIKEGDTSYSREQQLYLTANFSKETIDSFESIAKDFQKNPKHSEMAFFKC